MANSKESRMIIIDSVGEALEDGTTLKAIGFNINVTNATWSITLKTQAGITFFQSSTNSPASMITKPVPLSAGIECTALTACTMIIYYEA